MGQDFKQVEVELIRITFSRGINIFLPVSFRAEIQLSAPLERGRVSTHSLCLSLGLLLPATPMTWVYSSVYIVHGECMPVYTTNKAKTTHCL